MGWRTDDAYDRAAREEWRKLPLRDRYQWDVIALVVVILAAVVWFRFA